MASSMSTTKQNLVGFTSWSDVIAAAKRGDRLWCTAALDLYATQVIVRRVFKNGKIRVAPLSNQGHPFTADSSHLGRFRRRTTVAPTPPDRIEFDADEIQAASTWHGGQASMLYAIASTGDLSRGTSRPQADDDRPMTDHEWLADLAGRLADEAEMAAASAIESFESATHAHALDSIATKCRAAIAVLTSDE